MCITVLSDIEIKKARKNHRCDACRFLRENISEVSSGILSFKELREIARVKQNGYLILKGESYRKQYNIMDGEGYSFKYIKSIHDICLKYGLYPEV